MQITVLLVRLVYVRAAVCVREGGEGHLVCGVQGDAPAADSGGDAGVVGGEGAWAAVCGPAVMADRRSVVENDLTATRQSYLLGVY